MKIKQVGFCKTKFRAAIDDREECLIPPLSLSKRITISFYSDRNLNEKMIFKILKLRNIIQIWIFRVLKKIWEISKMIVIPLK